MNSAYERFPSLREPFHTRCAADGRDLLGGAKNLGGLHQGGDVRFCLVGTGTAGIRVGAAALTRGGVGENQ